MNEFRASGFTLIELVILIVILGIIAAVAAPRFIDLSDQANESALAAQASALEAGAALNFAAARTGKPDYDVVDTRGCEQSNLIQLVERFDTDRYEIFRPNPATFQDSSTEKGFTVLQVDGSGAIADPDDGGASFLCAVRVVNNA